MICPCGFWLSCDLGYVILALAVWLALCIAGCAIALSVLCIATWWKTRDLFGRPR